MRRVICSSDDEPLLSSLLLLLQPVIRVAQAARPATAMTAALRVLPEVRIPLSLVKVGLLRCDAVVRSPGDRAKRRRTRRTRPVLSFMGALPLGSPEHSRLGGVGVKT